MEIVSTLLLTSLYATFFLFLFWGIYILRLAPKERLNRGFFYLCLALSIWAIGFATAHVQPTLSSALFWRRISAIGWTSVYGIFLHFLLLLTRTSHDFKKKNFLYLLHVPSFFFMVIFSFSSALAKTQYNLVKVPFGWINVALNSEYDYLFYVYYLIYILASMAVVWNWRKHSEIKKIHKQSKIIFAAILSAFLLGSLSDILLNVLLPVKIPQLGPLVFLLPMGTIYYAARYSGLFGQQILEANEVILTLENEKKLFIRFALIFILGGVFGFISEIFPLKLMTNVDFYAAANKALVVMSFGILLMIVQGIKNEPRREMINLAILILSIPAITLAYIDRAGITIWVVPIILMVSSLVFNKRILLFSATIMGIISQRLIWIMRPSSVVIIDNYDFILRIGLFILVFYLSLYVNRIYVARLKEIAYQVSFQKINSEISSGFINMNQENFQEKVESLLAEMGLFFHADRTYVFSINQEKQTVTYSHEWCAKGISREVETIKEVPVEVFSWWLGELEREGQVYIMDVGNMPPESLEEQTHLLRQNVKSLIAVPLQGKENLQGFIGIDAVNKEANWTYEDIKLLKILANLLSSGLTKIKVEEEVAFLAYYDQLTGLPNRSLFEKRLTKRINKGNGVKKPFSLIFIDLDSFKMVNDTIGHRGGDLLLTDVADRIQELFGETTTIARFGGDEFLILLDSMESQEQVKRKVDELMTVFIRPFSVQKQEFFITCSAGIATYPVDGEDAQSLIKNADTAMYTVKYSGKNQSAFCTPKMKEDVYEDMRLTNDLYSALENDELMVYYQPQINLSSGQIVGAEALLRWNHPQLGMIPPQVFIPLAEKASLINPLGLWVLRQACERNKDWQDKELWFNPISVNLSGVQFINQLIMKQIRDTLNKSKLDPKYLEIEITESTAIKQSDRGLDLLVELKKMGISIAIDDFGIEYSSLSRLKILPIDRIKIDMQFIQGIGKNEKDEAIIMVIINLAKRLGLNVIAEGVETEQQLGFLKESQCDEVQGYYYYKPMSGEDVEKVLRKQKEDDTRGKKKI